MTVTCYEQWLGMILQNVQRDPHLPCTYAAKQHRRCSVTGKGSEIVYLVQNALIFFIADP